MGYTYEKHNVRPDLTLMNVAPGRGKLQEWDVESIWHGIILVAYWYEQGSYEGDGFAVYTDGVSFGFETLGHCSCYGPCENREFNLRYSSIEELKKGILSAALYQDSAECIAVIEDVMTKSAGYGGGYEI
jgi:hypothetical protein